MTQKIDGICVPLPCGCSTDCYCTSTSMFNAHLDLLGHCSILLLYLLIAIIPGVIAMIRKREWDKRSK